MKLRALGFGLLLTGVVGLAAGGCGGSAGSTSGDGDSPPGDGDGDSGDGDLGAGDGDSGDGDMESADGGSTGMGTGGQKAGDGDGDLPASGGESGSGGESTGTGGDEGTGGSRAEAPPSDACVIEQIGTCGDDCGESVVACDTHYTCSGLTHVDDAWPPVTRIPAASELCESADGACPFGSPTALRFLGETSVRLTIPDDWSALVVSYDDSNDDHLAVTCAAPKTEGCLSINDVSEAPVVLFFPKGADSGARNLTIERSETPLECP